MKSFNGASASITGALVAVFMAAGAQAQEAEQEREFLFPVDTILEERMRPVPSGEPMPYSQILTFTRSAEACFINKSGAGQMLKLEYYLLASPADIGITEESSLQNDQKRREAFVNGFGDDLSRDVYQIWTQALKSYHGDISGIGQPGDPVFIASLKALLDQRFEDFESETGISANIKPAKVEPGTLCAEI